MEKSDALRPAFDLTRIDQAEKVPKRARRKAAITPSKIDARPNPDGDQADMWPEAWLTEASKADAKRQRTANPKDKKKAAIEPPPPQRICAGGLNFIVLKVWQIDNDYPPTSLPDHFRSVSAGHVANVKGQHLLQVARLDGAYKIVSSPIWAATLLNGTEPTDQLLVHLVSNPNRLSLAELREDQTAAELEAIPRDWKQRLLTISAPTLERVLGLKLRPADHIDQKKQSIKQAGQKNKRGRRNAPKDASASAARLHVLVKGLCSVRNVQDLLLGKAP